MKIKGSRKFNKVIASINNLCRPKTQLSIVKEKYQTNYKTHSRKQKNEKSIFL